MGADLVRRAAAARVRPVVSDADPPDPGPEAPPGRAWPARARPGGRTRSSSTRRVRRRSGTGWTCRTRPPAWGWGKTAHLLVGSLAHSGPVAGRPVGVDGPAAPGRRAGPGQPRPGRGHPVVAVRPDGHRLPSRHRQGDRVVRRRREALRRVRSAICPPRSGNRKGVVEKINHTAAQRWWRTLADDLTVEQAQADLSTGSPPIRGDTRLRPTADGKATRGHRRGGRAVAARSPRTPYPVIITETRTVSRQALVAYRGNRYSVPPELAGGHVTRVPPGRRRPPRHRHRLRDRRSPGTGSPPTGPVWWSATTATSSPSTPPRWPAATGPAAPPQGTHPTRPGRPSRRRHPHAATRPAPPDDATVTDLAAYERAATGRNTLP